VLDEGMPIHRISLDERVAFMNASAGYVPLGGSRRRFYDLSRREVISYRQYRKRHGIFSLVRGDAVARRVRSDKGCMRQPLQQGTDRKQPFVKLVQLSDGQVAEVLPFGHLCFCIVVQHRLFAQVSIEQCGTRRKWHCNVPGCSYVEKNQERIALHCYQAHYHEPWEGIGNPPETVLYTGEVRTNERRARMPWRVPAQSRRPFFGK